MSSIQLSKLSLETNSQARVATSEETVEAYTAVIKANKTWVMGPKMVLFFDGETYYVADGWHRIIAAGRAGKKSLPESCFDIRKGDAVDAMVYGMTAADKHGLRMNSADKRRCVEYLLDHGIRGEKQTQTVIAELAGVSPRTVKRIVADRREALKGDDTGSDGSSADDGDDEGDNGTLEPVDKARQELDRMADTATRLLQSMDEIAIEFGDDKSAVHSQKSVTHVKALLTALTKWKRSL